MAILRGHFAMMLILTSPTDVYPQQVEIALAEVATEFCLTIIARPLDDELQTSSEIANVHGSGPNVNQLQDSEWTINVYGTDKIGIVHGVTSCLAQMGINIISLRTQLSSATSKPIYAMVIQIRAPHSLGESTLRQALDQVSMELDVKISAIPIEDETF
jgi:glycine cleavage system regulatory protein